jgi:pyruvate,water dikinase
MTRVQSETRTFANPFEVATPRGAEGWEQMFPYYVLFSPERSQSEQNRFWFYNGMHFPEPIYPFDIITADVPYRALGQINTRVFAPPPALPAGLRVGAGARAAASRQRSTAPEPSRVGFQPT